MFDTKISENSNEDAQCHLVLDSLKICYGLVVDTEFADGIINLLYPLFSLSSGLKFDKLWIHYLRKKTIFV